MVDFIHNNKELYGVEAICRILPIAASTYYRTLDLTVNPEHRAKRDLHDLQHAEEIKRIWKESSGRYGVRKVWQQLKRDRRSRVCCRVVRRL
jgi:hypothetical protein